MSLESLRSRAKNRERLMSWARLISIYLAFLLLFWWATSN